MPEEDMADVRAAFARLNDDEVAPRPEGASMADRLTERTAEEPSSVLEQAVRPVSPPKVDTPDPVPGGPGFAGPTAPPVSPPSTVRPETSSALPAAGAAGAGASPAVLPAAEPSPAGAVPPQAPAEPPGASAAEPDASEPGPPPSAETPTPTNPDEPAVEPPGSSTEDPSNVDPDEKTTEPPATEDQAPVDADEPEAEPTPEPAAEDQKDPTPPDAETEDQAPPDAETQGKTQQATHDSVTMGTPAAKPDGWRVDSYQLRNFTGAVERARSYLNAVQARVDRMQGAEMTPQLGTSPVGKQLAKKFDDRLNSEGGLRAMLAEAMRRMEDFVTSAEKAARTYVETDESTGTNLQSVVKQG